MSLVRTVGAAVAAWMIVVSVAHLRMNLHLGVDDLLGRRAHAAGGERLRVGYLPVTCHLTCPVTHYINENMSGDGVFVPIRFNGWPELKEAFLARHTQATFILAPMAMKLREEGAPLKIVYLGHRDGTAMMVRKDSSIWRVEDLRGKKIAVPNRYSNQRLLVFKALRDHGMSLSDVQLLEMPPPDMPAALYARAVDAVTSGEPFMGQTELDGYGRVLWLTKDVWPGFISCVLAVHEDFIRDHRDQVQRLVDGIAKSGKWIDESMEHRMDAAVFVAQNYYMQDPRLLSFVLSKPPDRVKYTNLTLQRADFEEIEALAVADGLMQGVVRFEDYCDTSFVRDEGAVQPYRWEAPK